MEQSVVNKMTGGVKTLLKGNNVASSKAKPSLRRPTKSAYPRSTRASGSVSSTASSRPDPARLN